MCWKSKSEVAPKIATSDIKVYKILKVEDGELKSPCQGFKWDIGIIYKTDMTSNPCCEVNYGFHCMNYVPITDGFVWRNPNFDTLFGCLSRDKIFEAIIPTDSMYYENEYGEIVSNQLKILKPLDCNG